MSAKIILASTSPFRKEVLHKILSNFDVDSPNIDESRINEEDIEDYVKRLAINKAQAIAAKHKAGLIIGSDQAAVISGKQEIIGKPADHNAAVEQLLSFSEKTVTFYTSLCLYDAADDSYQVDIDPFNVGFRKLTKQQVESYLLKEKPYNCAGSFKSEKLGIALFSKMDGSDPNSLIGLPLIKLIDLLKNKGVEVL
ncbi:MAG: septum formation inhibitor Maf [Gammaproteobacteria bacterium]|nr:MAG: septum formation inhibitor Maf [Gammaproteobacteria bacterium]